METINTPEQLERFIPDILGQYRLPLFGTHGVSHWGRVFENGQRLAAMTAADPAVVALFAIFHDACRVNEVHDPDHGRRGAALAESMRTQIPLEDQAFTLLLEACRLHTDGLLDADPTVQTCWDSDRLDLPRVGISIEPGRLCTRAARQDRIVSWATSRSRSRSTPGFVEERWLQSQPPSRSSMRAG